MDATEESPTPVEPPRVPIIVAAKLEPSTGKISMPSLNWLPERYVTISVGGSPAAMSVPVASAVLITFAIT